MRGRTLRTALVGLAALLLGTAAVPSWAQTLRIGISEDIDTLDPAQGRTFGGRQVFAALCDKLFDIDERANVVGRLVTRHEVSVDGLTVTLHLRDGVTFHDGTPFDAAAVKFNLERALTIPESARRGDIRAIRAVEVVDARTARLSLSEPFAPLFAQLADRAGMMVSPRAAAAVSATAFSNAPVCSGPFRFVERVPQDRIVLERFDGYWNRSAIKFDRIVYLPVPDATVRLNNLLAGQLDLIEQVGTADLERLRSDRRFRVAAIGGLGFFYLQFNVGNTEVAQNPFGTNARLRQAVDAAIDREILNRVVFGGNFIVGNQPVAPTSFAYARDFPVPPRDLARARALVAEAGVASPTIEVVVTNAPAFLRVAQVIQSMTAEAGIRLNIRAMEANTANAAVAAGQAQAQLSFWSGRADPDGNIYSYLGCNGNSNTGKYCRREVEDLLSAAARENSVERRAQLYAQAAAIWRTDAPTLFLYHPQAFFGMRAQLEGFKPIPDGIMRLEDVSLGR